jgi:hypothetical protein
MNINANTHILQIINTKKINIYFNIYKILAHIKISIEITNISNEIFERNTWVMFEKIIRKY